MLFFFQLKELKFAEEQEKRYIYIKIVISIYKLESKYKGAGGLLSYIDLARAPP